MIDFQISPNIIMSSWDIVYDLRSKVNKLHLAKLMEVRKMDRPDVPLLTELLMKEKEVLHD